MTMRSRRDGRGCRNRGRGDHGDRDYRRKCRTDCLISPAHESSDFGFSPYFKIMAGGRLYRDEGLWVWGKKRKRARVGASTLPGDRLRAQRPSHVWVLDFEFELATDCRTLKY